MTPEELFEGDWRDPSQVRATELADLQPGEWQGELFEQISDAITGPSRASQVFVAMNAGLSYMPQHQQLMHLYDSYDLLINGPSPIPEREVQLGLRDSVPDLLYPVLAYGLRPDLLKETHDPAPEEHDLV